MKRLAHNHMVEDFDFQELAGPNQITGHFDVRVAWGAIFRGDNACDDDRGDGPDDDFDGDPRKSVSKAQAIEISETFETLRPVQSRSSCGSC